MLKEWAFSNVLFLTLKEIKLNEIILQCECERNNSNKITQINKNCVERRAGVSGKTSELWRARLGETFSPEESYRTKVQT